MNSVNFKTIWVLSLLLLVIILLSGIKICKIPQLAVDQYIDVKYREPFEISDISDINAVNATNIEPNDYNSLQQLVKRHFTKELNQFVDQERQNQTLAFLDEKLENISTKVNDIINTQ